MGFAEKKFRGLPAINQAKKIADLLAAICDPEIKTATELERLFQEAVRLSSYINDAITQAAPTLPPASELLKLSNLATGSGENTTAALRAIYEAYLFWRNQAGLGPETHVIQRFSGNPSPKDRPDSRHESIDYSVWLHNIRSGFNTGAVMRTAECFGFRRAYLSGFTPDPQQRSVQAAAMGCETWIDCQRFDPRAGFERPPGNQPLIVLESPEVHPPANALCDSPVKLSKFQWPASAVLIVGNEELGVPAETLARADAIVTIPMYGRKASLNLASSFAIAAAAAREFWEQNWRQTIDGNTSSEP